MLTEGLRTTLLFEGGCLGHRECAAKIAFFDSAYREILEALGETSGKNGRMVIVWNPSIAAIQPPFLILAHKESQLRYHQQNHQFTSQKSFFETIAL